MRTAMRSIGYAWLGHFLLVNACLGALAVHTVYRVPAGPLLLLLPWLGVAVTTLSALMLVASLIPRTDTGILARVLDGLDRRSVASAAVLIPASLAAATLATTPWLRVACLALGVVVTASCLAAIARRLVADGGRAVATALRWTQRLALVAVGAFLLGSFVVFLNGAFDDSAPSVHDSEVVSLEAAPIDTGLGHLVPHSQMELRSWRAKAGFERLVLTPSEERRVWVGQPVRVHVHGGRMGIPWVSAVRLDDLRHARQVLEVSPTAYHALKQLTSALLERRQLDEALVVTQRYLKIYAGDVQHAQFVAGHLEVAGRFREEVELMEPVVARRPDYTSLCMLGTALAKGGNPQRGLEVLIRATRVHPDSFLAFHHLGELYTALGRHEEAIAAYEAELVRRPRAMETRRRIQTLREAMARR